MPLGRASVVLELAALLLRQRPVLAVRWLGEDGSEKLLEGAVEGVVDHVAEAVEYHSHTFSWERDILPVIQTSIVLVRKKYEHNQTGLVHVERVGDRGLGLLVRLGVDQSCLALARTRKTDVSDRYRTSADPKTGFRPILKT